MFVNHQWIPISAETVKTFIFVTGSCNNGSFDGGEMEGGTILAQMSFEESMFPFMQGNSGADIYTDSTAPDGNRVLRFTYPPSHPGGYATDIVWVWFEQGRDVVRVE